MDAQSIIKGLKYAENIHRRWRKLCQDVYIAILRRLSGTRTKDGTPKEYLKIAEIKSESAVVKVR